MSNYNPTPTELRQAYEVAYGGEMAIYLLYGKLFCNVPQQVIERLYSEALTKVKEDMDKLVFCAYCENTYPANTAVCEECKEYDGLSLIGAKN